MDQGRLLMVKITASDDGRTMAGRWQDDGRTMAGRWQDDGRTMAGRWQDDGRTMAGRWQDDGRTIGPHKEAILFTVEDCNFCNSRY